MSIMSTSFATLFNIRPLGVTLKKLIFACNIVLSMLSCKTLEAIKQPTYNVVVPNTTVNTAKSSLVKYINYKQKKE